LWISPICRDLLGAPADAPLALDGTLAVTPLDLDREALIAAALEQRPEMRLSRTAQAGAQLNLRLSELGNRPKLSLDVSVGAKNGYQPNLNTLKANFTAGVAVDFPVFDGFRTRSATAASDAELRALEAETKALELRVVTEVDQAITDVRASTEKIGTAELQVRQAEQALVMAQTRYAAGVITNLDLLDVQTALAEARLTETKAQLDLVLSRYALDQAAGNRSW